MPIFCGYWGAPWGGFWLFPLIGLLFMAVMAYLCFRGSQRWMAGCGFRMDGESERLRAELRALREEVAQLRQRG